MAGVLSESKIIVEIRIVNPEKILNILWANNIRILNVKRIDIATVKVTINYCDYEVLEELVSINGGKINIVASSGILFFLGKLKRKSSLVIGGCLFLVIIMYLSNFIWRIEINTIKNVSPYEIRQQLYSIGIKPGVKKTDLEVKEIEKKIESINPEVLWIRARMEGATLKINIEEKVNPPQVKDDKYGNLISGMEGEVTRVYTYSGRALVSVGEVVRLGDVLIEGMEGNETVSYEVEPRGVVMANTFYEKKMNIQIQGKTLKRTGEKDSDIYLKVFGKKIYLKKAIKDFKEYDKIEESRYIFNKVVYWEKGEVEVDLTEDEAVECAVNDLEKTLINTLTREAKVVDRIITTEKDEQGSLIVSIVFVVEQNIVDDTRVEY